MEIKVAAVRADRLVSIVLLLQGRGGMSAPELARRLEVSVRTIYRDLDALSTAGVPVYTERGKAGGVRLLDGYRTDLTGLSPGEAEALFLLGLPGPLDQLGFGPVLEGAQRKLLAALPPTRRRGAERTRQRVHVDATGWDRQPGAVPHLAAIAGALWQDRRLRMSYVRSDNAERERLVGPLGLVLKAGNWYLVGSVIDESNALRVFRASRVRSLEVLDEDYRRPDDFDLASFWDQWLAALGWDQDDYPARLRCDAEAAADLPRFLGEAVRARVLDAPVDDAGRL